MSRWCYLAARKLSNDITLEEMQELEQILKNDPQLATQLEMHERYFNANDHSGDMPDEEMLRAWDKITRAINNKALPAYSEISSNHYSKRRSRVIGVIAMVILLLVAGYVYKENISGVNISARIESKDTKYDVTLPDGSKVTLNKNSNIYLSEGFGKTNRNLTLEGEAFFQVTHNAQVPFIVSANLVEVKVLGTIFNMRAYRDEEQVETSLIRGSVKLRDMRGDKLDLLLKPNEKITIHTQSQKIEEVSPIPAAAYEIETLKAEKISGVIPELAWTENKLVFNDESFTEVAKKLEKWYNVTIQIDNETLLKEKFTAIFQGENVNEALTALQITFPFKFYTNKNGQIIIEK